MTKKCLILSVLLLMVLFLPLVCGCQPTPDTPPVVGKNNTPIPQASGAPTPMSFETPPAHWKEDAPITLGELTVTIDADITVPDVTAYPIIRVKDKIFTQEEADQIVAVLSEGKELYSAQQTRAELEQQLIELKAQLAQYKKQNNSESLTYTTESMITETEEQIKALPENEVIEPPSTKFERTEVGAEAVGVHADLGKSQRAFIGISNRTVQWPYSSSLEFYNGAHYWPYNLEKHEVLPENGVPVGVKTTKEQAAEQAQAMLDKLGIRDMQLAVVRPAYLSNLSSTQQTEDVQCWQLTYERRIQGIPVSIFKDNQAFIKPSALGFEAYNSSFNYETLTVQVDDTGIILFLWVGPVELLDTINENATLLPFADIQQRIKEQLPKKYTNLKFTEATQVHVTGVELGLARVRIKDAQDDYMLIPVWDVYGYNDETSPYISGLAKTNPQNLIETLLTVNAMDGSVIDRNVGY